MIFDHLTFFLSVSLTSAMVIISITKCFRGEDFFVLYLVTIRGTDLFIYKLLLDRCFIFWSDWTDWSDCITGNKTKSYFQERKRTCSQTARCNGESYESQACAPFDIRWSAWSLCSCVQKVQHRLPIFIHGCRKCEQLQRAEYRICEPANCTKGNDKV